MKKKLWMIGGVIVAVLGLNSCGGDYYMAGATYHRDVHAVGFGHGYGFGGAGFSTVHFWSTGNPRWGYDPVVCSYYDFHRRAYYDPFLTGYYPVGFRPYALVGVPHPIGFRQGWCPPPRIVNQTTIVNYQNRESAYRGLNHGWAKNVRQDSRFVSSRQDIRGRDHGRNSLIQRSGAGNDSRFINRNTPNLPGARDSRDGRSGPRSFDSGSRDPRVNSGSSFSQPTNRFTATPAARNEIRPEMGGIRQNDHAGWRDRRSGVESGNSGFRERSGLPDASSGRGRPSESGVQSGFRDRSDRRVPDSRSSLGGAASRSGSESRPAPAPAPSYQPSPSYQPASPSRQPSANRSTGRGGSETNFGGSSRGSASSGGGNGSSYGLDRRGRRN